MTLRVTSALAGACLLGTIASAEAQQLLAAKPLPSLPVAAPALPAVPPAGIVTPAPPSIVPAPPASIGARPGGRERIAPASMRTASRPSAVDLTEIARRPLVRPGATLIRLPPGCDYLAPHEGKLRCMSGRSVGNPSGVVE